MLTATMEDLPAQFKYQVSFLKRCAAALVIPVAVMDIWLILTTVEAP